MSTKNTAASIVGASGILAASAQAAPKRAASDPLKGADSNQRNAWFKACPDRWNVIVTLDWGDERSLASELETVILDADAAQWPSHEKKLVAVLKNPECTEVARDFVVRMLRMIGSPACVGALKSMLANAKQADVARYALESIDGEEASAALRDALGTLKGAPKAGVIGSLAVRGDKKALPALKAIAADAAESAEVRESAERAATALSA